MCGIFGYIKLKNGHFDDTFKSDLTYLAINSKERGDHSTGFAYVGKNGDADGDNLEIRYEKQPVGSDEFVRRDEWRNLELPDVFIGHTRWATQGSVKDPNNNHPIIGKETALVHNGHIYNDDKVFKSFGLERSGEVDSEAILRLLEYNIEFFGDDLEGAVKETTPDLAGRFACAFVNKQRPNELFLFRHDNPIELGYIEELGVIVFASERRFIEDAFRSFTMKLGYFIDSEPRYKILYRTMENDSAMTIDETGVKEVYSIQSAKDWWANNSRSYDSYYSNKYNNGNKYAGEYVKTYTCPLCESTNLVDDLNDNLYCCNSCNIDLVHYNSTSLNVVSILKSDWEMIKDIIEFDEEQGEFDELNNKAIMVISQKEE